MRAYPWQVLPRWTHAQVALVARLCDACSFGEIDRVARALGALLDVEADVAVGLAGVTEVVRLPRDVGPHPVVIALEHPMGRLGLELEPSLALAIVDRVLGGEGTAGLAPAPLSDLEAGVLAFVAARACASSAVVVVDVLGSPEGFAAWIGEGTVVCLALELRLGARRGPARLWVPERTLARLEVVEGEARIDPALGELPVTLAVRVGRASLPAAEIAALEPGDVLLPDDLGCAHGAEGTVEASEAELVSGGGGLAVRIAREGGQWHVRSVQIARGTRAALVREDGTRMSEEAQNVGTGELAVVAEVPVELSIELGRIELRVSEIAALVPGRVISARIPVGGPVELRAGGRVVATGELVDVEGELGVRILARPKLG